MLKRPHNYLERFKTGFNVWLNLVIYCGSVLFAAMAFVIVFRKMVNPLAVIGFGVLGCLINYLLSRKLPKRFPLWHNLKQTLKGFRRVSILLFLPPLSVFLMSAGLGLFIAGLFIESFADAWQRSLQLLPYVFSELGLYFVLLPVFMVLLFAPVVIILIYVSKLKIKYPKAISIFLAVIYALFITFLLIKTLGEVDLTEGPSKVMAFILGFIPLHWFFEIFVSSVINDKTKRHFFSR